MSAINNEPSHLCEPKNPTQNNNNVVKNEQSHSMNITKYDNNVYTYNDGDIYYDNLSMLEMFGDVIGRLAGTFQYGHGKYKHIKYKITITRTIMDN